MKLALLTASLATAVVASAAELKDPDAVALDWKNSVALAPLITVPEPGLRNQVQPPPVFSERSYQQQLPLWDPRPAPAESSPFDGIIRPPDYDPKRQPKGAKPYQFKGDTYWLIPLTT
jgi:hypothetical protein